MNCNMLDREIERSVLSGVWNRRHVLNCPEGPQIAYFDDEEQRTSPRCIGLFPHLARQARQAMNSRTTTSTSLVSTAALHIVTNAMLSNHQSLSSTYYGANSSSRTVILGILNFYCTFCIIRWRETVVGWCRRELNRQPWENDATEFCATRNTRTWH